MEITIILATDLNGGIGFKNKIPWSLKDDLKLFKETTMGHHIVMGRKTYESLGRPLPGRTNLVLSRGGEINNVKCFDNPEKVINFAEANNEKELFIIGGAQIYSLFYPYCNKIYLTLVETKIEADTFYNIEMNDWNEIERVRFEKNERNEYPFYFITLKRKNYDDFNQIQV